MKKILFGLSLIACAAATMVPMTASAKKGATCVSFSPAGYCDSMQYDSKKSATWVKYDCSSSSAQTTANLKKGITTCDGATGCEPSYTYGWDSLDWKFDFASSTGTLTGMYAGTEYVLQQDMPVSVTPGVCPAAGTKGGVSVLAH
jgi:hypothetical protein